MVQPANPLTDPRPLVGVNLKLYFGVTDTLRWLGELRAIATELAAAEVLDLFVLPSMVTLEPARDVLRSSGIRYGAQNVWTADRGAYTGETSPADLRELGCTVTSVGHAERRRLFGEDDALTADKAAALARHAITPIVCIGESTRESVADAVAECRRQIDPVLNAVGEDADVIFAYEPVWAIGAAEPAPTPHIVDMVGRLRTALPARAGATRIIYGGSAGPGLYPQLAGAVDGMFFGRFVHDPGNLRTALAEMADTARQVV
jgi:triosephosphate isomerase